MDSACGCPGALCETVGAERRANGKSWGLEEASEEEPETLLDGGDRAGETKVSQAGPTTARQDDVCSGLQQTLPSFQANGVQLAPSNLLPLNSTIVDLVDKMSAAFLRRQIKFILDRGPGLAVEISPFARVKLKFFGPGERIVPSLSIEGVSRSRKVSELNASSRLNASPPAVRDWSELSKASSVHFRFGYVDLIANCLAAVGTEDDNQRTRNRSHG